MNIHLHKGPFVQFQADIKNALIVKFKRETRQKWGKVLNFWIFADKTHLSMFAFVYLLRISTY